MNRSDGCLGEGGRCAAFSCSRCPGPLILPVRHKGERKNRHLEFEPRDQFEQRQKKLEQIQALGYEAFPREFRWTETPADIVRLYSETQAPELEANKQEVRLAGRIVSYRLMGKAGFAHVQGAGKRVQVYVRKDVVGEKGFALFQLLDLGDHIYIHGTNEPASIGRAVSKGCIRMSARDIADLFDILSEKTERTPGSTVYIQR